MSILNISGQLIVGIPVMRGNDELAKAKKARDWRGLNPIPCEESWRRQIQYAATQHINPIDLFNIGYREY